MNWTLISRLILCCGLTLNGASLMAEGRGGGGGQRGGGGERGGGDFNRGGGGGGFNRGGAGGYSHAGDYGSIRNTGGMDHYGAGAMNARPGQYGVGQEFHPAQGEFQGQGYRQGINQLPNQGEYAGAALRNAGALPYAGITPGELPLNQGQYADGAWQNWQGQAQANYQNWNSGTYNGAWDNSVGSAWWQGNPVAPVGVASYLLNNAPCQNSVLANGGASYYYCNSSWYQPVYGSGNVQYLNTSPPAGVQFNTLQNPYQVNVGGSQYYVDGNTFYQQQNVGGQSMYVTVPAPVGAVVKTIPNVAVQVQKNGASYYRYGDIFYQTQGNGFVVVPNPGF